MNSVSESQNNIKDIMSWLTIALITAGAFFCTYYYTLSGPYILIIWIVWLCLTAVFTYFTSSGKQLIQFTQDSKVELLKVVWPTRQETVQTTTIVIVMVALTGFVLWGVDSLMMWVIAKITHLG